MNFFKVERNLAMLLLLGAILGAGIANSGGFLLLDQIKSTSFGLADFSMTFEGWVYNFGIPAFFALVGLELRRELSDGLFQNRKALLVPALAALGGVLVPAVLYLAVVGLDSTSSSGWPIPTATDVTFALAVLLVFGKKLPAEARTFLLAFAIIDDVIGILIITVMYSGSLQITPAISAIVALLIFYALGMVFIRSSGRSLRFALGVIMCSLAFEAVYQTLASGIQPTIAGLLIGLLVPISVNPKLENLLHPWIAGLVLPVFAFMATGITINLNDVWSQQVFWAVLTRPLGKVLGITLGAYLAYKITKPIPNLPMPMVLRLSVLGGIGFTVSLLICQITFTLDPAAKSAAVASTLIATLISAIAGAVVLLTAHGAEARNGS